MNWNNLFKSSLRDDNTEIKGSRALVPLDDHRLILVEGADAINFLQGQCTCDFMALSSESSVMGAHCSAKGRMHSSFLAAKLSHEIIGLRVHESIAEPALAELKKYAMFSKVSLSISHQHFLFAELGETQDHETIENETAVELASENDFKALRINKKNTEYWCQNASLESLIDSLTANARPQKSSRLWRLHNIQNGIAEVEENIRGKLIPQEINFQLINGISFSKGCYTGQEVIARLHYRGQLKKHMRRAIVHSTNAPQSSDAIVIGSKNVGTVINSAKCDENTFELLALCNDASYQASLSGEASVHINQDSSSKLAWQALPYAIN